MYEIRLCFPKLYLSDLQICLQSLYDVNGPNFGSTYMQHIFIGWTPYSRESVVKFFSSDSLIIQLAPFLLSSKIREDVRNFMFTGSDADTGGKLFTGVVGTTE